MTLLRLAEALLTVTRTVAAKNSFRNVKLKKTAPLTDPITAIIQKSLRIQERPGLERKLHPSRLVSREKSVQWFFKLDSAPILDLSKNRDTDLISEEIPNTICFFFLNNLSGYISECKHSDHSAPTIL